MIKILFLILFGILVIPLSCRTEFDSLEVESQHVANAKRFAVFSKGSQFAKNGNLLDYSEAFGYLAQKYDSVNNSNISGLVNTKNIITHKSDKKLRSVLKSADLYVEFKLHSKTVYEENGDIWVLFPKIKNGKVIDLVAGLLTENETEVYYITLDKTSSLFLKNVDLYQKAFNKYFKIDLSGNIYTASTSARCGFPGSPACEIEEVIIIVGGGESGYSGGLPGGSGSPGGGCPIYIECIDDNMDGGGGGDNTNPNTPSNDPCAKAQAPSSTATLNSKATAYTNAQTAIVGMNNGLENGVVLGNVNGTIQATGVQTGGESSIGNLISSFSNPIGDIHNHPNNNPPSPGDFYSLINIRNQHSNYNTRYVVTLDGTTYALVVTDVDAMNQFLQKHPPVIVPNPAGGNSVNFPNDLLLEWSDLRNTFSLPGALAFILNEYNSGITLTKMDSAGNFRAINIPTTQNSDGTTNYNFKLCPN